ncbi:hypothetical protein T484DRAFT_1832654, partial [Baffinella frigidus]
VNVDPTELLIQQLKAENERLKLQLLTQQLKAENERLKLQGGGGGGGGSTAGMTEEEKEAMRKQETGLDARGRLMINGVYAIAG